MAAPGRPAARLPVFLFCRGVQCPTNPLAGAIAAKMQNAMDLVAVQVVDGVVQAVRALPVDSARKSLQNPRFDS